MKKIWGLKVILSQSIIFHLMSVGTRGGKRRAVTSQTVPPLPLSCFFSYSADSNQ